MTRSPRSHGFTLLELLVAVTITLLLAGLMLTVVTNTLSLWQRTQDGFSTATQAKLLLDLVERDLQGAVFRKDGGAWLAAEVLGDPPTLGSHGWLLSTAAGKPATESLRLVPVAQGNPAAAIGDARFGLSGVWLRLIATNVESSGSLPVAVAYQIARRPLSGPVVITNAAEVRYTLFRSAVSPANTLAVGNEVTAAGYGSNSAAPTGSRNPATLTNPNSTDALATNVVDFGVWLYLRDAATGGLRRIFPADNGDRLHIARDTGAAPDDSRFPEVADVMVRILTEQGAAQLRQLESATGHVSRPAVYGSDAEWWWALVEANSRVYTRRIEMKGAAL